MMKKKNSQKPDSTSGKKPKATGKKPKSPQAIPPSVKKPVAKATSKVSGVKGSATQITGDQLAAVKSSAPETKKTGKPSSAKAPVAPAPKSKKLISVSSPVPVPNPFGPTPHSIVENIQPLLEFGYPVKLVLGESLTVTADIYRDGHEKCEADLLYRQVGDSTWIHAAMSPTNNDAWQGVFTPHRIGAWEFAIEARTFPREGYEPYAAFDAPLVTQPSGKVRVDPPGVEFTTWYEMWPRSQGTNPAASASFDDMIGRLGYIKDLGFDVIYLPPIHPIGVTNRKGPNNTLKASRKDPGCPYAIGNSHGGHKAVDPELGTLKDCRRFLNAARAKGFTVALDFALNCSPDHPYVKDHPDWFYREADGSIKYAENPPKKYEDIYPLNLHCEDREALWLELKSVLDFWIDMGISIFRVDNPHTKPFALWEWLIAAVKAENPSIIFLAEAFTRPKIMKRLAKGGFDLSYTYFTWRTTAEELREYVTDLAYGECSSYMKPIFFPTTPDILPWHLQDAPPATFKIRLALAATLVGAYGMYNSYELCENKAYPGKEEFWFSEKYQYKVWDWDRPGNIKGFIRRINEIRRQHACLWKLKNITFHDCDNPNILAYSKAEGDDVLLFVVNLDSHQRQAGTLSLDLHALKVAFDPIFGVYDLLSEEGYAWQGNKNYVELSPEREVLHIFKVERF
jgi:starch synthase (maltosyl-transferring)